MKPQTIPMVNHLGQLKVPLKAFVGAWIFFLAAMLYTQTSYHKDNILAYVTRPAEFRIREFLGKTPPLSKNLKILAFDNKTLALIGKPDLQMKDFALLLKNIADKKPKMILLDRLFSTIPIGEDREKWMQVVRDLDVPIFSGATFYPREISFQSPLPGDAIPSFDSWFTGKPGNLPENIATITGYLYGFRPEYRGAFKKSGHLRINADGTFYPFVDLVRPNSGQKINQDKNTDQIPPRVVPHAGMYVSNEIEFKENKVFIDDREIPINSDGKSVYNHRPTIDYYRVTKPISYMIQRARNGIPEKNINEGDVVIIQFAMFTGGTDFFEGAPFGPMPGGFLVATIMNSVLTGNWLKEIAFDEIFMSLFCLLGIAVGLKGRTILFWVVTILVTISYFFIAMYLFSWHGLIVPWLLPLVGFIGSGVIFYVHGRLGSELDRIQIEKNYLSEKSRRLEEENQKIKLEQRINLGRAVQEILLPEQMEFSFCSFFVGMQYIPAQEMSGDWFYIWEVNEKEKVVILGDVMGKGPSAAIPVAVIIGILGECERQKMPIVESLKNVNRRILELFKQQITSTCTAAILRSGGEITLFNAGSPGWVHMDQGKMNFLPLRSGPLGLNEQFEPGVTTLKLTGQSHIFAFTDGYMEGSRAIKRVLRGLEGQKELDFETLQQTIDEIGKDFRLEDDKSMLYISSNGKA